MRYIDQFRAKFAAEAGEPAWAGRFWAKVRMGPDDKCWEWTAGKFRGGYGQMGVPGGRSIPAQRAAWELTHGPIPVNTCVLHRCDNPPCCNPAHLFLGTRADNMRDMWRKGRGNGWACKRAGVKKSGRQIAAK